MPAEFSNPPGLPPAPTYSHVVRVGNTVYVAGQTAQNAQGEIVGRGDVAAQATQVMENIRTALQSVGGDLSNLVKTTIFITDPRFREALAGVRARYLSAPLPASTLVVCAALAHPDYLVEIEGVAVID